MLCTVSVPAHFESFCLFFVCDSFGVCVQTYQRSSRCFCLHIVAAAPFAFILIEIKALFPEALCVFFVCVCVCLLSGIICYV